MYLNKDQAKITALGAAWTYNWSPWVPASTSRLETVPMIWGSTSATASVIDTLSAGKASGAYTHLLGFNEPDHSSQANMTPEQAIALWPQLEKTGLKLGSPAPAVVDDGWLKAFMTLAQQRGYRVDFIALHFYVDYTDPTAVSRMRDTLTRVHNEFGKPIWITELGAVDTRPWGQQMAAVPTEQRAVDYLVKTTAMLDALPFVQRYAWFTDNCWSTKQYQLSSLYDGAGTLTPLGAAYRAVS
jgi:hypothetical protein